MPNHMTHRMRVIGDAVRLREFVKKYIKVREDNATDKYEYLDFDAVIPMPKEIETTDVDSRGSIGYDAWYGDWHKIMGYEWVKNAEVTTRKGLQKLLEKLDPQYKKQADKIRRNMKKYGAGDSLDWSIENWGTKWNSYDLHFLHNVGPRDWGVTEIEFMFDTAWSPPTPVLGKLSEMEPDLWFGIVGYEGGMGFSCKGSFQAGLGDYECSDATPERYEEVFGVKPEEPEDEGEDQD